MHVLVLYIIQLVDNTICLIHIKSPGATSKKKVSCVKIENKQKSISTKPTFQKKSACEDLILAYYKLLIGEK